MVFLYNRRKRLRAVIPFQIIEYICMTIAARHMPARNDLLV